MSAPRGEPRTLVVLGAAIGVFETYRAARRLGLRTLAVDMRPDAPALPLADETLILSTRDVAAIHDALRDRTDLCGIVAPASDIALCAQRELASRLDLPCGLSGPMVRASQDKVFLRQLCDVVELPTCDWVSGEPDAALVERAGRMLLPVVVKPVDARAAAGSPGARIPGNWPTRCRRPGPTPTRDGSWSRRRSWAATSASRQSSSTAGRPSWPPACAGSPRCRGRSPRSTPCPRPSRAASEEQVRALVDRVCAVTDYQCGPLMLDLVVDADDKVRIVELGARVGGDPLGELVRLSHGVDTVEQAVRIAVGMPVETTVTLPRRGCCGPDRASPGPAEPSRRCAESPMPAPSDGVAHVRVGVAPGDTVKGGDCLADQLGYVLATGDDVPQARRRASEAAALLDFGLSPDLTVTPIDAHEPDNNQSEDTTDLDPGAGGMTMHDTTSTNRRPTRRALDGPEAAGRPGGGPGRLAVHRPGPAGGGSRRGRPRAGAHDVENLWSFLFALVPFVLARRGDRTVPLDVALGVVDARSTGHRHVHRGDGWVRAPDVRIGRRQRLRPLLCPDAHPGSVPDPGLALALRMGGATAGQVRRSAYACLLVMLSGLEDLMFSVWRGNDIPDKWEWAEHMTVRLGHVASQTEAFVFNRRAPAAGPGRALRAAAPQVVVVTPPRLTGRYAIHVVGVDELLSDGWLATRLPRVARGAVACRIPGRDAGGLGAAGARGPRLSRRRRAGRELCAGLLGETVSAMPGMFHVHHRHSAAEQSFWHDPDCRDVLPSLVRELRRRLRWRMTTVMWRQVLDDDEPLPGRRLVAQETVPLGVVPLVHGGAEEWLQSLGKSRRQDLRRLRRRHAEDDGLEISQGPFAEVVKGEEVAPLLASNFDRHNPRKHPLMNSPAGAPWLDVTSTDVHLQAVAYRDRGELVAAGVVAMHGGVARWLSWGALYLGNADKRGFYYDAVRRIVELSYAGDNTSLVLGKGMGELKSSFGARLYAQRAVVRTSF